MTRLIHTLGRWRRTHCEACGHPITALQTGMAVGRGDTRLMHLHFDDCANGGRR
jgi:hypothetical protein